MNIEEADEKDEYEKEGNKVSKFALKELADQDKISRNDSRCFSIIKMIMICPYIRHLDVHKFDKIYYFLYIH